MQQGLGALFVAGWTVDDVLGLSWSQLEAVSGCIAEYRAMQMNTVLEVVASSLGGKVKKPARRDRRAARVSERKKKPPGRSAASKFASAGFQIQDG